MYVYTIKLYNNNICDGGFVFIIFNVFSFRATISVCTYDNVREFTFFFVSPKETKNFCAHLTILYVDTYRAKEKTVYNELLI